MFILSLFLGFSVFLGGLFLAFVFIFREEMSSLRDLVRSKSDGGGKNVRKHF